MSPTAASPDPDTWHPARLIPTAGIRGQEEQERRATSCLLAVMSAVSEFGRALVADVGAPRGHVSNVEADLRTQRLTTSVTLDAPQEGRPQTRVNWMLRQLR